MTGSHLLLLSARTEAAVQQVAEDLATALDEDGPDLADVAYTLAVGRRQHRYRRVVIASSRAQAAQRLRDRSWMAAGHAPPHAPPVIFLFPGQGAQWAGMGAGLYAADPRLRARMDEAADALTVAGMNDPRSLILDPAADGIDRTEFTQPAIFMLEYALASFLVDDCGVRPSALLGHSLGEIAAACLAGVLSLADAARLVTERGEMMQNTPPGAMLSVAANAEELQPYLPEHVSLAAVNGPRSCVVSGSAESIEVFGRRLTELNVAHRRLTGSRAFHSSLMDPILEDLTGVAAQLKLNPPKLPMISNVTGDWITDEQATDPAGWARQARATVRFSEGLAVARGGGDPVVLEVGPGRILGDLARAGHRGARAIATLVSSGDQATQLEAALGQMWVSGVDLDQAFRAGGRRRVSLPSYPFERVRHWVDGRFTEPRSVPGDSGSAADRLPLSRWLWRPSWRQCAPADQTTKSAVDGRWLIFGDRHGISGEFAALITAAGGSVQLVSRGPELKRDSDGFTIDTDDPAHYRHVLRHADPVDRILLCGGYGRPDSSVEMINEAFYTPLWLFQALAETDRPVTVHIISSNVHRVGMERDSIIPERALSLGLVRVASLEHSSLNCRNIDLPGLDVLADAERALSELATRDEPVLAVRGGAAWVPDVEPVVAGNAATGTIRAGGHYLITGGLGGIGIAIAGWLLDDHQARITLLGRTPLGASTTATSRLEELRTRAGGRGQVEYRIADVADEASVHGALDEAEAQFGDLAGVFHCAGTAGAGMIAQKARSEAAAVLAPKVTGTAVLAKAMADREPDFVLLCSSHNSLLGRFGQVDYCAANAYLDAVADRSPTGTPTRWISVHWDVWSGAGMAVDTELPQQLREWRGDTLRYAIRPAESGAVITQVLGSGLTRVVVSTRDFRSVIAQHETSERQRFQAALHRVIGSKPVTVAPVAATAPSVVFDDPSAQRVVALWQELLGVPQVGLHDSFLDLGGHSLIATMLLGRLRRDLGVDLTLRTFLERPTVAAVMDAKREADAARAADRKGTVIAGDARSEPVGTVPVIVLKATPRRRDLQVGKSPQISLMFFAADAATTGSNRYGLLLDAARFADQHGLHAIWLPERHFNGFGGLYPNPSVLAAAIAPMTSRVRLRAGSVISPLHMPVRIAEEWAVVDNLSHGRVDLSFGSGWNVNDFVLAPDRYAGRKEHVLNDIDVVRRLWRGDPVTLPNGAGAPTQTAIFPKPVQSDVSVWLTGESPQTFSSAGANGHHVLTALMHQDVGLLAKNIEAYRSARRAHGHDPGHVTLMQHTFVVADLNDHYGQLRTGYRQYVETNMTLQLGNAAGFGVQDAAVSQEDIQTLADRNLDRLIETSGMIGSVNDAKARLEQLTGIGVNEVACLIDFIPDTQLIHTGLAQLAALAAAAGDTNGG